MTRDLSIIKDLISKSTIKIKDNQGTLLFEDENYLLEAHSNFNDGKTSVDFWIGDDEEFLSSQEKDLIWEKLEEERQLEAEKQLDADEYQETLESLPRV